MKYIVPLLLLLLCPSTYASNAPLSRVVMAEETAYQLLNIVDIGQTLDIKRHDNVEESFSRSFIGAHPSDTQVVGFLGVTAVAHYAITRYMVARNAPTWAMHSWEALTIGVKANCIRGNYRLGLKIAF